jgi:uncharacterized protein (TIGR03435 family)
MKRRVIGIFIFSGLAMGLVLAQSQDPPLAFDVASIKLSKPGGRGGGIRPLAGGQTYVATNVPVRQIIKLMYRLADSQLVGGPNWLDTEFYDVEGKTEMKGATSDQLHEMFQTLLADRFKLRFHTETRETARYVLTVDKSGSKMKVSELPNNFDIPLQGVGRGKIAAQREPMSHFCWFLSQGLNAPVVDKTGLDKNYDFTLEWSPELQDAAKAGTQPPGNGPNEPPPSSDGPTLFTALREQLGLKLELQKGPVQVFVIDHAERPAEN